MACSHSPFHAPCLSFSCRCAFGHLALARAAHSGQTVNAVVWCCLSLHHVCSRLLYWRSFYSAAFEHGTRSHSAAPVWAVLYSGVSGFRVMFERVSKRKCGQETKFECVLHARPNSVTVFAIQSHRLDHIADQTLGAIELCRCRRLALTVIVIRGHSCRQTVNVCVAAFADIVPTRHRRTSVTDNLQITSACFSSLAWSNVSLLSRSRSALSSSVTVGSGALSCSAEADAATRRRLQASAAPGPSANNSFHQCTFTLLRTAHLCLEAHPARFASNRRRRCCSERLVSAAALALHRSRPPPLSARLTQGAGRVKTACEGAGAQCPLRSQS